MLIADIVIPNVVIFIVCSYFILLSVFVYDVQSMQHHVALFVLSHILGDTPPHNGKYLYIRQCRNMWGNWGIHPFSPSLFYSS